MPVRFRCVYCNQLLGIARRKAGQVVRCTNCGGQIIVPEAEPKTATVHAGGEQKGVRESGSPLRENLFERANLDELLRPFEFDRPAQVDEPTARTPSSQEIIMPRVAPPMPKEPPLSLLKQYRWPLIAGGAGIAIVSFLIGYFVKG